MGISAMLREDRDEVLSRFVSRVRELQDESDTKPVALILDGLPGFLDNLVLHLAPSGGPHLASAIRVESAAEEHGEQRFDIGVDIVTMAKEWTILRDVLLELLLERGHPPTLEEYRVLSRQISAASLVATARYVELSEADRQRLAAEHVGFVVHDLRNQVQGAMVALELLQRGPDQREVALECLAESIHGLRRALDRELSRSRLEALRDVVDTAFEQLSPVDLVRAVIREARPLALARDVTFEVTCDDNVTIWGDARLLSSALANIIGNAVKFTLQRTAITIRISTLGDQCTIHVADQCGGLSVKCQESLFSAHVHGAVPGHGYGLGLAIARQSVELHRGVIEIADDPGVGCHFRVILPTRLLSDGPPCEDRAERVPPYRTSPSRRGDSPPR